MIVETTSNRENNKRMFYGIKSDGRPFFNSFRNINTTYFCSIEVNEANNDIREESEIFVTKKIDNDIIEVREHLFSISKNKKFAEIYKFNKKEILKIDISELSQYQMDGLRGTIFNYPMSNNNNNLIVFGYTNSNKIYLKSLYFLSNLYSGNQGMKSYEHNSNTGHSLSCFVTDLNYIFCFFFIFK